MGAVYFFETHWYIAIILYGTTTKVIYIHISMKMSNIMTCFLQEIPAQNQQKLHLKLAIECDAAVWWCGEGRHPGSASGAMMA
jgi:hypothetical protein